jgi:purine-nucleoside phosphorylase
LHFYEGHPWSKVMQPIMIARDLGARYLLLTNAAGGIREDLVPGKLLAVNGHIDWTQGYRGDRGPTRNPHDQRLNSLLLEAGRDLGMNLPTGLYAQVTGPCYETPAEIRALKSLGVDAVGMSTAREVVAGFELGLTCAALSCITNRAAGLGPGLICHDDVLASTLESRDRMAGLLECFLRRL